MLEIGQGLDQIEVGALERRHSLRLWHAHFYQACDVLVVLGDVRLGIGRTRELCIIV